MKRVVATWNYREPSEHFLKYTGKPRETCVEMAGLRTFRMSHSSHALTCVLVLTTTSFELYFSSFLPYIYFSAFIFHLKPFSLTYVCYHNSGVIFCILWCYMEQTIIRSYVH